MVQIGRRGTARRLFENFKILKNHRIRISKFWSIIFLRLSRVYSKKLDSIRTKLTEETDFEVCPYMAIPAFAIPVQQQSTDVRIQKCCVRIIPRFRTGGIRNWGRNRAVKPTGLLFYMLQMLNCPESLLLYAGLLNLVSNSGNRNVGPI